MHVNNRCNLRSGTPFQTTIARPSRRRKSRALACIIASAFLTCAALSGQQAPSPDPEKPQATQQSDQQAKTPDPQAQKQTRDSAHSESEKQIVEENAKLLKLATDLKKEVDRTTLDTLSITIIRKADQIEKLAHSLREKMKVTAEAAK